MPIFTLKPVYVEARQVDIDNLQELATWCNGHVLFKTLPVTQRKIELNKESKHMRADIGDWIIKHSAFHFSVKIPYAMDRDYLEIQCG